MKKMRFYLLGNPKIIMEGADISEQLSAKAFAMFIYLAVTKGKRHSRDKLAELFWGESGYDSAAYNLRYNLWSLKKVIDEDENGQKVILSDKSTICINPECNYFMDLEIFDTYREDMPLESLLELKKYYRGNFLDSFILKKSFDFNDWIFFEREKYQRLYLTIQKRIYELYSELDEDTLALDIISEMLDFDPLNEELYEQLMKLYMKLDDRHNAILTYKKCSNILREELNISPRESFKCLYQKICKNQSEAAPIRVATSKIAFCTEEEINRMKHGSVASFELVLSTKCYPISGISYYYLSTLVEEITHKVSEGLLTKLPKIYWQDIARVDNNALKYAGALENTGQRLTESTEKNKIFNSMMHLICMISHEVRIAILIENLQFMDEISFEFIKYFLFKQYDFNGQIFITGKEHEYLSVLNQLFNASAESI